MDWTALSDLKAQGYATMLSTAAFNHEQEGWEAVEEAGEFGSGGDGGDGGGGASGGLRFTPRRTSSIEAATALSAHLAADVEILGACPPPPGTAQKWNVQVTAAVRLLLLSFCVWVQRLAILFLGAGTAASVPAYCFHEFLLVPIASCTASSTVQRSPNLCPCGCHLRRCRPGAPVFARPGLGASTVSVRLWLLTWQLCGSRRI